MKQRQLSISDLLFDKYDPDEVIRILSNKLRLHEGAHLKKDQLRVSYYFSQERKADGSFFEFLYNSKNGKLLEIKPGPLFSEEILEQIKSEVIKALVVNPQQPSKVGRFLLFSSQPLKTYWKNSELQIIPPPAHAPKPKWQMGDFPFIVEQLIPVSNNNQINVNRYTTYKKNLAPILSVLFNTKISSISESSEFYWTLRPSADELITEYLQTGYGFDGFETLSETFSSSHEFVKTAPISAPVYYSPSYGSTEMLFPDIADSFFRTLESLDHEKKRTFRRAAYWFHSSKQLALRSKSIAFLSIMCALESFLPDPKFLKKCTHCNRNQQEKSTADLLREFLFRYAAGVDKKFIDELYKYRSKISHGATLLIHDINAFPSAISPDWLNERNFLKNAEHVTQNALLNWISDQK